MTVSWFVRIGGPLVVQDRQGERRLLRDDTVPEQFQSGRPFLDRLSDPAVGEAHHPFHESWTESPLVVGGARGWSSDNRFPSGDGIGVGSESGKVVTSVFSGRA